MASKTAKSAGTQRAGTRRTRLAWYATVHQANARQRIDGELEVSGNILQSIISSRNALLQQASYILSRDYAFQQAFATNDRETVLSALQSLKQRVRADLMMLLSIEEEHRVIVDTFRSDLVGKPFPAGPLIAQAEEGGRASAGFVARGDRIYSIIVA
ncbi:MAG: hypothetical protein HY815_02705, partial [Candidatus Riflebacteria bacterium]|nr:hypothetical protein [Candidatus Riflebacteria bacterium]